MTSSKRKGDKRRWWVVNMIQLPCTHVSKVIMKMIILHNMC
jgi:hypothetical protein